jgi:hypothetical protein
MQSSSAVVVAVGLQQAVVQVVAVQVDTLLVGLIFQTQ